MQEIRAGYLKISASEYHGHGKEYLGESCIGIHWKGSTMCPFFKFFLSIKFSSIVLFVWVFLAMECVAERAEMPTVSDAETQTADSEPVKIVLDPVPLSPFNAGVFEGWGTSLCWFANRLGYDPQLTRETGRLFFNAETGLGINIVRFNIGGGDDPSHDHIRRSDSNMPGYAADYSWDAASGKYEWSGRFDWTADADQRAVLFEAKSQAGGEFIAEAFSNSPPFFMTRSGCSSGAGNSWENNLKDGAEADFARYLAGVVRHYADGYCEPDGKRFPPLRFQSISPFNEPFTNYWKAGSPKQEGCHFDLGEAQSRMILAMDQAMKETGLEDVLLAVTEETSIDTQIDALAKLSPQALDVSDRINVHSYGGDRREELREAVCKAGKHFWMSEVDGSGTLGGPEAGEMRPGLWLARKIILEIGGLRPSAWVLWQLIDSHIDSAQTRFQESGNWTLRAAERGNGFWGLTVADHDKKTIRLTQKYYAFGQFTRYVRPGAFIIYAQDDVLAAWDPVRERISIVAVNAKAEPQTCSFYFHSFGKNFTASCANAVRTSGGLLSGEGEHWTSLSPIPIRDGELTVALKPYSVTTFLVPISPK